VVNIDNGFGAGYAASQINALASGSASPQKTPSSKIQWSKTFQGPIPENQRRHRWI